MDLTKGIFQAIVLKDKDSTNQGRYKVQIPVLMHLLADNTGIFVKNHTHNWRCTNSDVGIFGEYKPLQAGTKVLVKFENNDINTGYIERIISDQKIDTLPFSNITDRDDIYQLLRTAKYDNIVLICEDTEGQPPKSMHIYFQKYRTTVVVDEEGIHIHSDDNRDVEINKDDQILIKGDRKIEVKGSYDFKITGHCNIETSATCNIKAGADCNIQAGATCSIKAGAACNVTAPAIGLNSAPATPATPATPPVIPTYRNSVDKSDGNNTSRLVLEEE